MAIITWKTESEVRAEKEESVWKAIKAERDKRQQEGGFEVNGYWFHSDDSSRIQQMRLEQKAIRLKEQGALDTDVLTVGDIQLNWKTMTGEFTPMTVGLAIQIGVVAELTEAQLFQVAETHRASMMASDDPSSYDFSGGWPTAFWEREE